jgi:hypothetical protein
MSDLTIFDLPNFHEAPQQYFYEIEEYKRDVFRIWICSSNTFTYNGNEPSRSVWGFFNQKTGKYHSPINSKEIGKEVDIKLTRNWSAMPILQSPLEKFFA